MRIFKKSDGDGVIELIYCYPKQNKQTQAPSVQTIL